MGRKNMIEGQMNLFEYMEAQAEQASEVPEESPRESGVSEEKTGSLEQPKTTELTQKEKKSTAKSKVKAGGFPECADCWCATCEHSTVGGGKPRAFADRECACPSCEMCVSEGKADVCVIGSADEGCRFRAEKEGLV